MKKIFTLAAVVGATVFGASAQDLTPQTIELKNPSFELENMEESLAPTKGNTLPEANVSGWDQNLQSNTTWGFCNYSKGDANSGQNYGAWYVRALQTGGSADISTNVSQTIMCEGPGMYVVSAQVCATRNGRNTWDDIETKGIKGINGDPAQYGVLYVVDEEFTDALVSGAPGCAFVEDMGWRQPKVYALYFSQSFMPTITVGFCWGQVEGQESISKGWLQCDDFQLEYYPETAEMDPDEAFAQVLKQIEARAAAENEEAKALAEAAHAIKVEDPAADTPLIGFGKLAFVGGVTFQQEYDACAMLESIRDNGSAGVDNIIAAPVKEDNRYFNLQGIEVANPTTPGLYIHNGKKILVK